VPLPLGATSEREIIHKVTAFTPFIYPMMSSFAPVYHGQLPYGTRFPPSGVNYYPVAVMQDRIPYDHEPEPDGAPLPPVYDSVGYHSVDAPRRPPVPAAHPQAAPLAHAGAGSSDASSTSSASSATATGTFRLGPKGSIIKN
jgi:hypothetical protein